MNNNTMTTLVRWLRLPALALGAVLVAVTVWAAPEGDDEAMVVADSGGLISLRTAEISEDNSAAPMKRVPKDRALLDRDYVQQPPLIPHQIRGYELDLKANKCLSCHSWKMAGQTGAPRISPTHFQTREGLTLGDVSPRRYFCVQCHVVQADAKPLIDNDFKPVQALSGQ